MMRPYLYAMAASIVLSCAAATTPVLAQPRNDTHAQTGDRRPIGGDHAQAPQPQPQQHVEDGRDARRTRSDWRDNRAGAQWDAAQHNGYYAGSVWRRGPPPANVAGRTDVRLGYHPWRRGQRLGYYRTRYEVIDYRTLGRSHPRRGYHWVRDERGDALLVAIATGLIADIIIGRAQN